MTVSDFFLSRAKSIVAGVIAGAAFLVPVVDDGMEPSEWLGLVVAFLAAQQATYWTPNVRKVREGTGDHVVEP
jgi:hypothetical protein